MLKWTEAAMDKSEHSARSAPPQNLNSLIRDRLAEDPSGLAFVENNREITHAQFLELVLRTVSWLHSRGVQRGERVAVWMVNRVEWLALYFALARLGAALVAVNTRYRSEEVGYILSRSQAHRLILQLRCGAIDFAQILAGIEPANLSSLREIAVIDAPADMPNTLAGLTSVPFDPRHNRIAPSIDIATPEDLSILFTTSGTTSGPKLVMHPQRTITEHANRSARFYGLDIAGARLLAALPFCGTFGLSSALAAYAAGAPIYIMSLFDANAATSLLHDCAITHMFGSDEMYRRILATTSSPYPFPKARVFGFGAFNSSVSDFAISACERGVPLVGLYGSSEVLALFSMQPLDAPIAVRIQGGGRPVAGRDAHVRIRDVATGVLACTGDPGEIEIRTPCAFMGYFNDPESTSRALTSDGYFRTGDFGYLNDDSTFVFESRIGDTIRIGGFLVNPLEIEDVIKRTPGVSDAQVVAVAIAGQDRPVAFVVVQAGQSVSATQVISCAKAVVAPFKVPERVWFVDSYPVTSSANGTKIQRNRLREMAHAYLSAEAPMANS